MDPAAERGSERGSSGSLLALMFAFSSSTIVFISSHPSIHRFSFASFFSSLSLSLSLSLCVVVVYIWRPVANWLIWTANFNCVSFSGRKTTWTTTTTTQAASWRSAPARDGHPAAKRAAAEGRRRVGRHLPALPQDQVRRRIGTRLPLLQRPLLRSLRRQSRSPIIEGNIITCFFFFFFFFFSSRAESTGKSRTRRHFLLLLLLLLICHSWRSWYSYVSWLEHEVSLLPSIGPAQLDLHDLFIRYHFLWFYLERGRLALLLLSFLLFHFSPSTSVFVVWPRDLLTPESDVTLSLFSLGKLLPSRQRCCVDSCLAYVH